MDCTQGNQTKYYISNETKEINQLIIWMKQGNINDVTQVLLNKEMFLIVAFNSKGCWIIQNIIEMLNRKVVRELANNLKNNVYKAIISPHANHVVQSMFKVLTTEELLFILDEIEQQTIKIAVHNYGCRVICRIWEYSPTWLIQNRSMTYDIINNFDSIILSKNGQYIIDTIIVHGYPSIKHALCFHLAGYFDYYIKSNRRYIIYIIFNTIQFCECYDCPLIKCVQQNINSIFPFIYCNPAIDINLIRCIRKKLIFPLLY